MKVFYLLCTMGLLYTVSAFTEFSSTDDFGLTFTDNANYESTQKDHDFIWGIFSANKYKQDRWNLGLNLGFNKYSSQISNDRIFWGTSFGAYQEVDKDAELKEELGIFGTHYIHTPEGTTDFNYNNVGFRLAGSYVNYFQENTSFSIGPALEHTSYLATPLVAGRTENQISL